MMTTMTIVLRARVAVATVGRDADVDVAAVEWVGFGGC